MEMTTPTMVTMRPTSNIVLVFGMLDDVRLVDVVGEDGGEGADVAGHAAHESGDEGGDAEARAARSQVANHHQRKHFVIAVQACAGVRGDHVFADQMHQAAVRDWCRTTRPSRPGRMTMKGTAILKNEPMTGARRAERRELAASTRWTTRKSVVQ